MTTISSKQWQTEIVNWFDQHGRKTLPWQENKTPYRVWISEIMLQQTQVSTVIPYFQRFMTTYPQLAALAAAPLDDVLHLWAGLGYYSRARNLHQAAQLIMTEHQGVFPHSLTELVALPGIGESTAGAILAIAFNQAATILDGNVKRVLARAFNVQAPINQRAGELQLWEIARSLTPTARIADYTQAMMDIGATICLRKNPLCECCPVVERCAAFALHIQNELPRKSAKERIPTRQATFIIIKAADTVLLEKRPAIGIWGGLWSLPQLTEVVGQAEVREYCLVKHKLKVAACKTLPSFRHTFSHYHLEIHPMLVTIKKPPAKAMEANQQIWYNLIQPPALGLPKPVQDLLGTLS